MKLTQVYQQIRDHGKKLTRVRRALLSFFAEGHSLYTAPELLEKLVAGGLNVNKTTVYREIEFLLANEYLREVRIKSRVVHYESGFHIHHHHLVCKYCENIFDIESAHMESAIQQLEKDVKADCNFAITDHVIEFYGTCASCRDSSAGRAAVS